MSSESRWLLSLLRPHRGLLLASGFAAAVHALSTASYPVLLDLLTTGLIGAGEPDGARSAVRAAIEDLGVVPEFFFPMLTRSLWFCLAAVVLVKGLAQATRGYLSSVVGERVVHRLRSALFARLVFQAPGSFVGQRRGELYARVLADAEHIKRAVGQLLPGLLSDSLRVGGLAVVCVVLHPKLSLYALLILPLSLASVGVMARFLKRRARAAHTAFVHLGTRLSEVFAGLSVVATFRAEHREIRRFAEASAAEAQAQRSGHAARALQTPLVELIGIAAMLLTAAWASDEIAEGRLRPGEVVGFLLALVLIYEPLKGVVRSAGELQVGLTAAERVRELLRAGPDIQDSDMARPLPRSPQRLQLKGASVRYPGESQDALASLDLDVSLGMLVVLVGPSGSGKSTALRLINRLLEPTSGTVEMDGEPLACWTLESIRSKVAALDQGYHLFEGTLYDNLTYGAPDPSPARLEAACQRSGASSFIEGLVDGYLTQVGEGGLRLSAGQRQRVALARALVTDAPILLLDEPTSALDEASRRRVLRTLVEEARTKMVIIATHDPMLIDADSAHVVRMGLDGAQPYSHSSEGTHRGSSGPPAESKSLGERPSGG